MSVKIISRAAWGAKPWTSTPYTAPLSKRTEFFVHYDGAHPVGRKGSAIPKAIENIHLGNGWSGIGYNFVVDQDGNIYEGRGWDLVGAHCPNHNTSGIGVQIAIGGDQEPSEKALAACRALYDEACRKTGRTLAKKGHKDGIATACPGPKLYAWVKAGMPVKAAPAPAPSKPAPAKPATGTYVVKAGDTLSLIGERLKIKWSEIARVNGLKAPYTIVVGQKLKLPSGTATGAKPAVKPASKIYKLSDAVKPGVRHVQVKDIQQLLLKLGYKIPGAVTDFYGPATEAAVAAWHERNPKFKNYGLRRDTRLGPSGYIALQKQCGRR
ncbi:endolysin [Streptomyces phage Amela]|uniref:Endolysin n=1 Tax=Streptomyces phage Amela TaxID=1673877 RepID=A0A0K1Y9L3_9CAUD|nr:endolysin [Streptomyces phage Amela]AKY03782.1 endolysin [Streptomyces phage Amela]